MLIYYDLNTSPNCLKTKILLNELGIAYEQRDVDYETVRGRHYRERYPTGLSPAIEDGDLRISESAAIALYLAEKHGALIPKDQNARARMYQAMSVEAALLGPTLGAFGLFGEFLKPERDRNLPRIAELQERAQRVAEVLGALLGRAEYFAGEFSLADIQLYAGVSKTLEAGVFRSPPENLVAWCARLTARPSVASAREQYVPYRAAPAQVAV
jgi:glutathione S-transferase